MKNILNKIKKFKENKIVSTIGNILYFILVVIVLLILAVVLLQRVSNNTISLGGFRIFNVVSESMVPKYVIGDVLLSKEIEAKELQVGDDVVYIGSEGSFAGRIVTHQIIDKKENAEGKYIFTTKGIANPEQDPEINETQILGKVIYKIQSLSAVSKVVNNLYAFYFVIFVPIVILIFIEIMKTVSSKYEKDDDDENDDEDDIEKKDNK